VSSERIQTAVFLAIASLNETLPADGQIQLRTEASLGGLESLAITNLIVAVEDAMRDELDVEISLTDERTLALLESKELTPLRTVGTLIEHLRKALP
jgi:acyl carrier protein